MSGFVCKINGKDTKETWGVVFGDGSLSALQAPVSMKEPVTNESRLADGRETIRVDLVAPRDLTLIFYLCANTSTELSTRLSNFIAELMEKTSVLESKFEPGVKYRLDYLSCTNYKVYDGTMAKFVLKFNEPNPKNRS